VANLVRGCLIVCVALLVAVMPIVAFRANYAHGKRLRMVVPGFYRGGEMTADGFADAFARLGIRTVINVQDDFPDPELPQSFLGRHTVHESEWCARHGVRYVALAPDLISRRSVGSHHPAVIDEFLRLMDDKRNYPVLLHCKAGLHRTGILCAVYRMEYQGWSPAEAYAELKAHGFGDWVCTSANDYVEQYVLAYRRRPAESARQESELAGQAANIPPPGLRTVHAQAH
jgi:tyrosine-protein phosphatase SIW14